MFAEKFAQQCLFLKAFGCDGAMVNQVTLLTHGQNIGTSKTTSPFTISYPMRGGKGGSLKTRLDFENKIYEV